MQRYKCHKVVEAEKIVSVTGEVVGLESKERVIVNIQWLARFTPEAPFDLGYLVRYEDGYMSWSPSKTFEEGYTLLNDITDPWTETRTGPQP